MPDTISPANACCQTPDSSGEIGLIINIEAQNKYNNGYPQKNPPPAFAGGEPLDKNYSIAIELPEASFLGSSFGTDIVRTPDSYFALNKSLQYLVYSKYIKLCGVLTPEQSSQYFSALAALFYFAFFTRVCF